MTVTPGKMGQTDNKARKVNKEYRENKDHRVKKENRGSKDHRENREYKENKGYKAPRAIKASKENKGRKVSPVNQPMKSLCSITPITPATKKNGFGISITAVPYIPLMLLLW